MKASTFAMTLGQKLQREVTMKRALLPVALAAGLVAGAGPALAAQPDPLPTPIAFPPGTVFELPCPSFNVTVELTGSFKVIGVSPDPQIISSPNLRATVTANGNSATYVITGASHIEYLPNDITKTTATGRNLVFVPATNGHLSGLFLTVGNVSFTNRTSNNAEITRFSGTGTVLDVCQALA